MSAGATDQWSMRGLRAVAGAEAAVVEVVIRELDETGFRFVTIARKTDGGGRCLSARVEGQIQQYSARPRWLVRPMKIRNHSALGNRHTPH